MEHIHSDKNIDHTRLDHVQKQYDYIAMGAYETMEQKISYGFEVEAEINKFRLCIEGLLPLFIDRFL